MLSGYENKTLSCILFAAGIPGAGGWLWLQQASQEVEARKTDSLPA
jgi:hypothetical protein